MDVTKDYGIFFKNDYLLTENNHFGFILPISKIALELGANHFFYLGKFFAKNIYAINLTTAHPSEFTLLAVRKVLVTTNNDDTNLILRAKQLLNWHRTSQYCGSCGATTLISDSATAKVCSVCHTMLFPSSYCAIMVLIRNKNQILLARPSHFTKGMYSALAGFIDAGESCEAAIKREVYEEVGLSVKNINYFGSQSWPFPNSFMLAFTAEYEAGSISYNDNEIEDARWFTRHDLPMLPLESSIARQLIDSVIDQL